MGKARSTVPLAEPVNLEPVVAAVDRMRTDMCRLSQISTAVPDPNVEVTALVARLTLSLDELHRALASAHKAVSAAPDPKIEPSHRMGTHAVGNRRLLEWFREQAGPLAAPTDTHRYPFAVQQFLATRTAGGLPDPVDFQRVQCHDLSPQDIRYVSEHPPEDSDVVIALGLPRPIKFLLAEVQEFRSVYMYGRVGYLVTARFLSAIDHPRYWESFSKDALLTGQN